VLLIYRRASRLAVKGLYDSDWWVGTSLEIVRALEVVGIRIRISNLDVLRQLDSPVIFVANHMSTLEVLILPCLIRPFLPVVFIVKENLTRFPLFGPITKARHPILVGRVDPRGDLKAVMEGGLRRVADGKSIIVFPQTTRNVHFQPEKFNSMGVKLARRVGAQVVPVALKTDAWEIGRLVKEFGPIHPERPVRIAFGEPLTIHGSGREEHQQVIDFIQGKLGEWELDSPNSHS
jgi:1-acyl-sn-glycerol-3-phosphate acyltransferase